MTVLRNDGRWDRSNCIYRDGRVVLYDKGRPTERLAEMHWIDYGISVIERSVLARHVSPGTVADLADIQSRLSVAGDLAGLEVTERFYEAGSRTGLRDLEAHLLANRERPAGPARPRCRRRGPRAAGGR